MVKYTQKYTAEEHREVFTWIFNLVRITPAKIIYIRMRTGFSDIKIKGIIKEQRFLKNKWLLLEKRAKKLGFAGIEQDTLFSYSRLERLSKTLTAMSSTYKKGDKKR